MKTQHYAQILCFIFFGSLASAQTPSVNQWTQQPGNASCSIRLVNVLDGIGYLGTRAESLVGTVSRTLWPITEAECETLQNLNDGDLFSRAYELSHDEIVQHLKADGITSRYALAQLAVSIDAFNKLNPGPMGIEVVSHPNGNTAVLCKVQFFVDDHVENFTGWTSKEECVNGTTDPLQNLVSEFGAVLKKQNRSSSFYMLESEMVSCKQLSPYFGQCAQ